MSRLCEFEFHVKSKSKPKAVILMSMITREDQFCRFILSISYKRQQKLEYFSILGNYNIFLCKVDGANALRKFVEWKFCGLLNKRFFILQVKQESLLILKVMLQKIYKGAMFVLSFCNSGELKYVVPTRVSSTNVMSCSRMSRLSPKKTKNYFVNKSYKQFKYISVFFT